MSGSGPALQAPYPVTALVLQGGGSLGSYQAGVYEALAESGVAPNWIAGISIGALNAALIAGNPVERRVERLRAFWEHICQPPLLPPTPFEQFGAEHWPNAWRAYASNVAALRAVVEGQNGFFTPRSAAALALSPSDPAAASLYDTTPMRATLERFADFDRINDPRGVRVSIGTVNVHSGNFEYFDTARQVLGPEHFMASSALPPGFPPVRVGSQYYWDGGLVSNTPLFYVATAEPRVDALIFQVDLWSAAGEAPRDLLQVASRQKDIQFSSRTRMVTDYLAEQHAHRALLQELLALIPASAGDNPWVRRAAALAATGRQNVFHLIYRNKHFDGYTKDFDFGLLSMRDHWAAGLDDMRRTLAHPEWFALPPAERPFTTHDIHRPAAGVPKHPASGPGPRQPAPECPAEPG